MNLFGEDGYRPLGDHHRDYAGLAQLEDDLLEAVGGRDSFVERLRSFFRSAIDEVIDTARTGRYFLSDLEKTEKTYLGTKFEILLRDWLGFQKGWSWTSLLVDVKWTSNQPPEALQGG